MKLRRIDPSSVPWPPATEWPDVSATVQSVRERGDRGVAAAAQRFGDGSPRAIPRDEMRGAFESIDPDLRQACEHAARRIEAFACAQRGTLRDLEMLVDGMLVGHRAVPIERVGVYVPGGRYPLPSSVLMCAIPARVAGVAHVTMCTPDAAAVTLACAYIAGIDACFEIGGAQAVAAMAFGPESVRRVDLIVGPGNAYVAAAKRLVNGDCGIDTIAGPSELIVVASADADPALIAADLLAQAEHDVVARVMLVSDSAELAQAVDAELTSQLRGLATEATAGEAVQTQGCCAIVSLNEAMALVNRLAPEHLHLQGAHAEALAGEAKNYGALFVGPGAAEVFGDYGIGPNHVLPTQGGARHSSGLSVFRFLNLRTYQVCRGSLERAVIEETSMLAQAEGLEAHRRAALARTREGRLLA